MWSHRNTRVLWLSAAGLATIALVAGCGSREAPENPANQTATVWVAPPYPHKAGMVPEPEPAASAEGPCELPGATGSAKVPLENGGGFLDLPTYDGSGQSTHPNVQFDRAGRFGHRYWMVMTPYPFGDGKWENPSILASDDGLDWSEPRGVRNPVTGEPEDVARLGHYSDGYLLPRPNGFELWFRYNPARPDANRPDNATNIIYRMTSPDGVDWTDKEVVFNGGGPSFMSPSLLADGSLYRLWYSNYGGELVYTQSRDLRTWEEPRQVEVTMSDGYAPWHQEIVATDRGYEALLLGYKAEGGRTSFALFYAQSDDGLRFGEARLIDPQKVDSRLAGYHFYKSSLVKDCGAYQLYLSVVSSAGAYLPFYKQVPVESLSDLFA
ncbi:MAG: hypothetical protein LBC97_13240 [Bifidobacteriaceae bacterium]|jgi:hypothetical protein|nr:hypothetical protein [Bifidobacteriaceae bacterium]